MKQAASTTSPVTVFASAFAARALTAVRPETATVRAMVTTPARRTTIIRTLLVCATAQRIIPAHAPLTRAGADKGAGDSVVAARARGAAAGQAVNVDLVDDDVGTILVGEFGGSRQPPLRAVAEQLVGAAARGPRFIGVLDFLVAAHDHHRRPVKAIRHIVDLDAHLRVLAHPVDLLADGRKAEQRVPVAVVRERHRYDVRLLAARAGEAGDRRAREDVATLRSGQFVNEHKNAYFGLRRNGNRKREASSSSAGPATYAGAGSLQT